MNSHEDAPCDGEPATRYVARRDHLPQDGLGALLVHLMRCEVCEATVPGIAPYAARAPATSAAVRRAAIAGGSGRASAARSARVVRKR